MAKIILMWLAIAGMSYVQAIMFTWQSRARNQNDVKFFRKANVAAQVAYFANNALQMGSVWQALTHNQPWVLLGTGIIFVLSSNDAAIRTMKYLIARGR